MANLPEITGPASHGLANYPPGATFGPRQMRDWEFVWIVEGDAEFTQDDHVYAAPEGSIVLCRPGVTDAFTWDRNRRTRHAFFHFDLRSIPNEWGNPEDWPVVADRLEGDVLVPMFQHLLTWGRRGDAEMLRQTIATMLRIFIIGERATFDLPPDVQPDPVDRAIAYLHKTLEADPATAITLEDLADVACVTPEHLCRVFKRALKFSPMECVRLARLDRSVVLLSRSNFSVGQVAEMCGFASQFHFARRFKAVFGDTPTAIRARIREGATPPLPRLLRNGRR